MAAIGLPRLTGTPGVAQPAAGAVRRSVEDRLREMVSPRDFGAAGDGGGDDTLAFSAALAAIRPGGTLHLGDGYSYRLTRTLVLDKPINIRGGAKEQSRLLFGSQGDYLDVGDGTRAAIVALHSASLRRASPGDARRSTFTGFTAQLDGRDPAIRGFVVNAPCYFYEIDARNFTSDGFAVMGGGNRSAPGGGNANGSAFFNCTAQGNRGSGFRFVGDDANACVLIGCRAFANGEWGFYDDSLIGNTFVAPEADSNGEGGYYVTATKPTRSVFIGPYAETGQLYRLNPRCLVLGPLGDLAGLDAVSLLGLPNGDACLTRALAVAPTADRASGLGDGAHAGPFSRISPGLLDLQPLAGGPHFKIGAVLSPNYTDLMNGAEALIRFPRAAVTGNLTPARPYLPNGWITGGAGRSGIVGAGRAAPTFGSFDEGAIWLNDSPMAGGNVGWICVASGTPGVWKSWGAIEG